MSILKRIFPRLFQESIKSDTLQNEVIVILHHVGDALKALEEKDLSYVKNSLIDIKESAERLEKFLTDSQKLEIRRATSND